MTAAVALPPLYARWLDELLDGPIPAETNATCADCAMLPDADGDPAPLQGYNPETKCCTYLPELWNFLVGAILLDDDTGAAARGRATVEARIDRGLAVTPLGLGRTRPFDLLYRTGGVSTFGQSRQLRCPHYLHDEGGLCGVWRHREATCATWFCKHVRGAVGEDFWNHLHRMLQVAEHALAGWALLELGLDGDALSHIYQPYREERGPKLTGPEVDGVANGAELRAMWGQWRGRERELYEQCARLVESLAWADVRAIGGAQLEICARLVRDAHARLLSDAVPERPVVALVQITPRNRDRVRLATYSGLDALEVPAVVAKTLPYFDGRPTADVLADIRRTEGVTVSPSLVRKLADFGVLRDQAASRSSRA
jgi:hypothetical protein